MARSWNAEGGKNHAKNLLFFSFFAISANLPTRGHMIDFLVNLALNLKPKTLQKSTQEASNIDQKGYRKYVASWLGIWSPLGPIVGGFWIQVGRQVGSKIGPRGVQNDDQKITKNSSKKVTRVSAGLCGTGGWPYKSLNQRAQDDHSAALYHSTSCRARWRIHIYLYAQIHMYIRT